MSVNFRVNKPLRTRTNAMSNPFHRT